MTWAAINLEDIVDAVCSFTVYSNPREDRRGIGQKVKDARSAIRSWRNATELGVALDWLDSVEVALESRNALMHSSPLVVFDADRKQVGHSLAEHPRKGRAYLERQLTIGSLQSVREELENAQGRWTEVLGLVDAANPANPRNQA